MAVITTDILIEGLRRDDVFAWLSDFENHKTILKMPSPKLNPPQTMNFFFTTTVALSNGV